MGFEVDSGFGFAGKGASFAVLGSILLQLMHRN